MGRSSSQQLRKSSLDLLSLITKKSLSLVINFSWVKIHLLSSLYHIFKSQVLLPYFLRTSERSHMVINWPPSLKSWAFVNGLDNSFSLSNWKYIQAFHNSIWWDKLLDFKLQQEMFFFVVVLDSFPCSCNSLGSFNLNKLGGGKNLIRRWGLV